MAKDDDNKSINFSVDPNKTPVLFVESYLIGSNENSVTFNFAQQMLDGQQNIVSRVAMTRTQAKEFLKNLNDHIEKFEI